jgi:hypothetical protein
MEVEFMDPLEIRAKKFAALSDLARLQIVDMLALGDPIKSCRPPSGCSRGGGGADSVAFGG